MQSPIRTLRFGIMSTGSVFPAWQAQCIENLIASGQAEPALLILPDIPPRVPVPMWRRIANLRHFEGRLWSYYNRLVDRRAAAKKPTDLSARLASIPRMKCRVLKKGKFSEYFTETDLEAIREFQLDFLIRFAFNIIRGEILQVATYGVWSFHHGDIMNYRGGPPCFWEIFSGEESTGVTLQRLTERLDGGVVLKIGRFRTIHSSYLRNRDSAHFLGTKWPAELCRALLEGRETHLDDPPTSSKATVYQLPTNRQMLRFFWRLIRNATFMKPRKRTAVQANSEAAR